MQKLSTYTQIISGKKTTNKTAKKYCPKKINKVNKKKKHTQRQ